MRNQPDPSTRQRSYCQRFGRMDSHLTPKGSRVSRVGGRVTEGRARWALKRRSNELSFKYRTSAVSLDFHTRAKQRYSSRTGRSILCCPGQRISPGRSNDGPSSQHSGHKSSSGARNDPYDMPYSSDRPSLQCLHLHLATQRSSMARDHSP